MGSAARPGRQVVLQAERHSLAAQAAMRQIIVAVPAWGPQFVKFFLGPGLRSHRAAIKALDEEFGATTSVRYVVTTDRPEEVARAIGPRHDLTLLRVPY